MQCLYIMLRLVYPAVYSQTRDADLSSHCPSNTDITPSPLKVAYVFVHSYDVILLLTIVHHASLTLVIKRV